MDINERRSNTDEQQSNTDERHSKTTAQRPSDGESGLRCVVCGGDSRSPSPVRYLPAPTEPETHVPMCIDCWSEAVADFGILTEVEAAIFACEAIGFSDQFTKQLTTFPVHSQQEKRANAVDKLASTYGSSPTVGVVTALGVPLPPRATGPD